MNYDYEQSPLSRALLTGLFIGMVVTLLALAYNIIFRNATGFDPSPIINVSSIIFLVNLVFLLLGAVYFLFLRYFKKAGTIFMILLVVLTIFFVWQAEGTHRSADLHENSEFRNLLAGVVLLMGLGAICIPLLFHNKTFEEHVV